MEKVYVLTRYFVETEGRVFQKEYAEHTSEYFSSHKKACEYAARRCRLIVESKSSKGVSWEDLGKDGAMHCFVVNDENGNVTDIIRIIENKVW